MTKLVEMHQCDFNRFVMVEDDVGHVLDRTVRRDGNHGNRDFDLVGRRVQQQEAIHRALDEHARILLDQFALPIVAGGEVEIVCAGKFLDDAAHDPGEVAFAQVRRENADGHRAALAQGAGEVIRTVIESCGRLHDTRLRVSWRYRLGRWRVIENQRDRGLRQLQVFSQRSKVDVSGWR